MYSENAWDFRKYALILVQLLWCSASLMTVLMAVAIAWSVTAIMHIEGL